LINLVIGLGDSETGETGGETGPTGETGRGGITDMTGLLASGLTGIFTG
jgi:hypothetical protein